MPFMLGPDDIQRSLHLPAEAMERFVSLQRLAEAPALRLPDRPEAENLLDRLGVDRDDRADVLAARPDPDDHPALWWVLDRVYHDILASMGEPVPIEGFSGYPALPQSTGALGRHGPVWMYLALVPAVRQLHARRGIPDSIGWSTLGDALTDGLTAHRSLTGLSGLGMRGFGWTLPLRFRGIDYRIGRLVYNLGELSLGNGPCGYALGVHIPAGERLDLDASIESMARAGAFFARHFPDRPIAWLTCESWLMDPQLADHLHPQSNIVRFQQLFSILPLVQDQGATARGDADMLGYVFGRVADPVPDPLDQLDELPQESSLQRAYVTHLRAGHHWHVRTGWRPIHGGSR